MPGRLFQGPVWLRQSLRSGPSDPSFGLNERDILTMLIAAVLAIMFSMMAFPETDIGRGLRYWLVDLPARRLARIPRGRIVFYGLLALLGTGLVLMFEADGARLFGLMLPDTLVWFAMFDVGVFLDVFLIGAAIAAANGMRVLRAQSRAAVRQIARLTSAIAGRVRVVARARRNPASASLPSRSDDGDTPGQGPFWVSQTPYRAFSMA